MGDGKTACLEFDVLGQFMRIVSRCATTNFNSNPRKMCVLLITLELCRCAAYELVETLSGNAMFYVLNGNRSTAGIYFGDMIQHRYV